MGLESQLTNVSSDSLPILLLAKISNSLCYLRLRLFAILALLGILSPDHFQNRETDDATYDVVGSGLAKLVVLAEQHNFNRVFSYEYENKNPDCHASKVKCVVCLDCLDEGDEVRKLACRHVFHKRCFDGWLDQLKFNCPLCRADLLSEERVDSTRHLLGKDGLAWFSSLW